MSALDYNSHTSYDYTEDMIPKPISEDHKEKILALLQLYSDVITCDDYDLGCTGILKLSIDLGNATLSASRYGRCHYQQREVVNNYSTI